MKGKKKVILTVLCAVILVVGSVLGTMAYLTSKTATANNTFTVGNVSITLDEALVNDDGTVVTGDDAARVTSNTYKLMPGHTYTKDPTIHVAPGSEACWLFVKVDNGIANIEDSSNTIASQMAKDSNWTLVNGQTNVYAYKSAVSAGTDVKVFESFKIKGDAVTSKYANASISITGYAVQADGFSTPEAAWTAAPATWQQ